MMLTHQSTETVCKITSSMLLWQVALVKGATDSMVYTKFNHFWAPGGGDLQKIGEGGFGQIYDGGILGCAESVVKHVQPKPDATDLDLSLNEILILKNIDHPCIAKTTFPDPGSAANLANGCLMLMPKAKKDLEDAISKDFKTGDYGGWCPAEWKLIGDEDIRDWMFQILRALKYLHSADVAHSDLKPANILMFSDGSIKLCDFGLARIICGKNKTNSGSVGYFAPEAVSDKVDHTAAYTVAIDMWSLGCIIAEIYARNFNACKRYRGDSKWEHIFKVSDEDTSKMTDTAKKSHKRAEKVAQRELASKLLSGKDYDDRKNALLVLIARAGGVKVNLNKPDTFASIAERHKLNEIITEDALDLIMNLLRYEPENRLTAEGALEHDFFEKKYEAYVETNGEVIDKCDEARIARLKSIPQFLHKNILEPASKKFSPKIKSKIKLFIRFSLLTAIQSDLSTYTQSSKLRK